MTDHLGPPTSVRQLPLSCLRVEPIHLNLAPTSGWRIDPRHSW